MELSLGDERTREILTEILIDLIKTRKELFSEIIQDALEEIGLANAIVEGRKNEFVPEANIFDILDGNGNAILTLSLNLGLQKI